MVLVLMGVSGTGKTTIGKLLATKLGWAFVEGDDYHPTANVEKMRAGVPLTDEDRSPWLQALRQRIETACKQGENVILACSALKRDYRQLSGTTRPRMCPLCLPARLGGIDQPAPSRA